MGAECSYYHWRNEKCQCLVWSDGPLSPSDGQVPPVGSGREGFLDAWKWVIHDEASDQCGVTTSTRRA